MLKANTRVTVGNISMSLLELISELAEAAVFEALTEQMYNNTQEEKEDYFSREHLYSDDSGDVYYMENAQDLYNFYHDHYEGVLLKLFTPKQDN